MKLKIAFVHIFLLSLAYAMREQSVRVIGKIKCGEVPAANVLVKLWDEDDGPDPDDVLAEARTDREGKFDLEGSTRELTQIDPVLKIYHDCNDFKPGQRKLKFKIPGKYISSGAHAKKAFDFGVINLETIFPKEERNIF